MTPMPKPIRWQSSHYLSFVRELPCCVCRRGPAEAHHVRINGNSGTGSKPSDFWTIPLCRAHHAELHLTGAKTFQDKHQIDFYKELFLTIKLWLEA